MATNLTQKGQVTIPKRIRDALQLSPGCAVEFQVDKAGNIVIQRVGQRAAQASNPNPFSAARGKADIHWRTDELMKLLRGDD
jgi:AbrB family looped-hinge helix DNA binding protein